MNLFSMSLLASFILATLKLTGVLSASWLVVALPVLAAAAVGIFLFILAVLAIVAKERL